MNFIYNLNDRVTQKFKFFKNSNKNWYCIHCNKHFNKRQYLNFFSDIECCNDMSGQSCAASKAKKKTKKLSIIISVIYPLTENNNHKSNLLLQAFMKVKNNYFSFV